MFTGIIETTARVEQINHKGSNKDFILTSSLTPELKIDQSLAHNGVCLTVVAIDGPNYTVTAIEESLQKTNLNDLKVGHIVNLERAMLMNGRLDGHIVQGHVDQVGTCTAVEEKEGSWLFRFCYDPGMGNITIEKGSICINGVSLTVVDAAVDSFAVAIIPYTYEHTGFRQTQKNSRVNLEFDVIGKYVQKLLKTRGIR